MAVRHLYRNEVSPPFVSPGFFSVTHPKFSLSSTYKEERTDCVLDNENSCAGVLVPARRNKLHLAERRVISVSEENKELWQAIMEWLEIAKETDERLRAVRQELEKLAVSEQDVRF